MATTYTKSLSGDFSGNINIKQFQSEVDLDGGIVPTITGIILDDDDVDIAFASSLSAGEQTALDVLIAAHSPNPPIWDTFKFQTIASIDSPYKAKKKSLLCDTTGGNITVNLDKADRVEDQYLIFKKISALNTVTIDPHGSELIDGQSTKTLTSLNEVVAIQCDGTTWNIMAGTETISRTDQNVALVITGEKGDIIVDNGTYQEALPVGANGELLIADSGEDLGLKYGTISDVSGYVDWTTDAGASNIHNNNIVAGSITQHEASITHQNLSGAGTNTHAQIDTHIAATAAHGATGAVVGTTNSQTLTNKTITATTNNVAAKSLHSATTVVDVSAATAPSTGQVLTATSSTTATWQTAGGSGDVTGPGSAMDLEVAVFDGTGGKTITGSGRRDYGASATDPVSPTPQAGDRYYNTAINHEMCYDGTRSKWLSVATFMDGGGRNGTTTAVAYYRRWNGMIMAAFQGPHVPKGTIVRIGYSTSLAVTHTMEVHINGVAVSSLASGGAASAADDTKNDDFNAGIMTCYNAVGSATTTNLQSDIYYKLRA